MNSFFLLIAVIMMVLFQLIAEEKKRIGILRQ
jgi:hypothetical protein